MSAPTIPPPIENFGQRPFSFYPPILGIQHNEWRFERSTWSEMLVVNTKTSMELWVPRLFVGEISRVDEPVMIVGLLKELEYAAGFVRPHERRVIEISKPLTVAPKSGGAAAPHPPATLAGVRLDSAGELPVGRLIGAALVLGVVLVFAAVSIFRGRSGDHVHYEGVMQSNLGLGADADYHAVVRRLGTPLDDHWRSEAGELQYRILRYAEISAILMGVDRDKARYIGAKDKNWRTVDSVLLPDGRNTASMLRNLQRF